MDPQYDILCFLSNDWKDLWAAQQKIGVELSKRHKVLAFETLGFSQRKVEGGDLKRLWRRLLSFFQGEWEERLQLTVCPAPLFPAMQNPFMNRLSRFWVTGYVRRKIRKHQMKEFVVWTFLPTQKVLDLIDEIYPKGVIYECLDDFSRYEGAPSNFSEIESALVKRSDVVFVAARKQENLKKKINPATYLVHNASDVEHFSKALDARTPIPRSFEHREGPFVGFIGAFDFWVDTDLIRKLAQNLTEATILMIGPTERLSKNQMPRLKNIHWMGRVPYPSLPEYLKLMDVAILPYRKNTYMETADPIVMYDYLAAGKRVVATDFPAAHDVPAPLIKITATDDQFIQCVQDELSGGNASEVELRQKACLDFAREHTWKRRVEQQLEIIQKNIQ